MASQGHNELTPVALIFRSQSEGQVKVREETISNLEARVKHLTEERDDMMQQWKDKVGSGKDLTHWSLGDLREILIE